jgi:ligand-binding SRPBCC domain-containing protein
MDVYERRSPMPVSAEELFAWHARQGAFERLVAPWQRVKVIERHGGISDGSRLVLRVQAGPLRGTWVAEHHDVVPGRQFADRQASGLFKTWDHLHRFIPDGDEASILEDHLEYDLPGGPGGGGGGGGGGRPPPPPPGPSSRGSSAFATSARATTSSATRRRERPPGSRWR